MLGSLTSRTLWHCEYPLFDPKRHTRTLPPNRQPGPVPLSTPRLYFYETCLYHLEKKKKQAKLNNAVSISHSCAILSFYGLPSFRLDYRSFPSPLVYLLEPSRLDTHPHTRHYFGYM